MLAIGSKSVPFFCLAPTVTCPICNQTARMTHMNANEREKPTPLFVHYALQLCLCMALFGIGIWLLVTHPQQLDITTNLGLYHGVDFVDVVFVLMTLDLVSKLRPHANIAMGSRKQYGEFHVPTARLFTGGLRELREQAKKLMAQAPTLLQDVVTDTRQAT